MVVLGVGWFKRTLIHWSVRIFGRFAWWRNGRARKRGESRVIDVPPVKSIETRRDIMRQAPRANSES